jgi:hypothetical protein
MIVIDKWPGLITNASPYAVPPGGAVSQVNLQVLTPGRLTPRPGLATVTWASSSGATSPVRSAFRAPAGGAERILYQNAAGQVYATTGPS